MVSKLKVLLFFQEKMRFLVKKMKIFKCVCKNFAVQKVGMWKFAESLVKLSLKLSVGIWNFHESFKWNFQPHKKVSWNFHETFIYNWKFHETFMKLSHGDESFMKLSYMRWKFHLKLSWKFHMPKLSSSFHMPTFWHQKNIVFHQKITSKQNKLDIFSKNIQKSSIKWTNYGFKLVQMIETYSKIHCTRYYLLQFVFFKVSLFIFYLFFLCFN